MTSSPAPHTPAAADQTVKAPADAALAANAGAASAGEQDLARVQAKVEAARAELLRLLQEVVVAESRLNHHQASQLQEANEQLVVAALRNQAEAQAATRSLGDVTRLAELDPLTGLPNRALLRDRFTQAAAVAKRRAGRLALLFLDIDDFKQINDTLGHAAGDQALQAVAHRLGHAVRAADTVSRHSGDEFLILLTEVSYAADAAVIATKLLAALCDPMHVGDRDLRLTASIGISLYPDDGESIEALIGHADAAMYRAKNHGPGRFALHGDPWPTPPGRSAGAVPGLATAEPPTAHEQALAAHERRHAQLQEANEQLVLAALGAQALQAAAERAQHRQADFMAAVTEQLDNPLAPIHVAAAMPGRASDDQVLQPRAQALVDQQAARMARLVAAAAGGHAQAAGLPVVTDPQVSDLLAVIDCAVRDARPVLRPRQQRLTVAVPAGPVQVRGDAQRLGQLLGKLLDNASKYTPDSSTIRLDATVQGASAVLVVSDDGIGIAPAVVRHLFEPFGQDSRAVGLSGTGAGTGIGLPLVRALVNELGGTVAADSAGNGRGSRFVVTLPLAETTPTDAADAQPGSA